MHSLFVGLHHDFHDNLYILLKGHKAFTIAAPSGISTHPSFPLLTHNVEAPNMYLNGSVTRIHDNGLINYKGFHTMSDGSVPDLVVCTPSMLARVSHHLKEYLAIQRLAHTQKDMRLMATNKAKAAYETAKKHLLQDRHLAQQYMRQRTPHHSIFTYQRSRRV